MFLNVFKFKYLTTFWKYFIKVPKFQFSLFRWKLSGNFLNFNKLFSFFNLLYVLSLLILFISVGIFLKLFSNLDVQDIKNTLFRLHFDLNTEFFFGIDRWSLDVAEFLVYDEYYNEWFYDSYVGDWYFWFQVDPVDYSFDNFEIFEYFSNNLYSFFEYTEYYHLTYLDLINTIQFNYYITPFILFYFIFSFLYLSYYLNKLFFLIIFIFNFANIFTYMLANYNFIFFNLGLYFLINFLIKLYNYEISWSNKNFNKSSNFYLLSLFFFNIKNSEKYFKDYIEYLLLKNFNIVFLNQIIIKNSRVDNNLTLHNFLNNYFYNIFVKKFQNKIINYFIFLLNFIQFLIYIFIFYFIFITVICPWLCSFTSFTFYEIFYIDEYWFLELLRIEQFGFFLLMPLINYVSDYYTYFFPYSNGVIPFPFNTTELLYLNQPLGDFTNFPWPLNFVEFRMQHFIGLNYVNILETRFIPILDFYQFSLSLDGQNVVIYSILVLLILFIIKLKILEYFIYFLYFIAFISFFNIYKIIKIMPDHLICLYFIKPFIHSKNFQFMFFSYNKKLDKLIKLRIQSILNLEYKQ